MKDLIATQSSIALIDDDVDFLEFVSESLKPYFSQVFTTSDFHALKELMQIRSVNVVVTDLKMPDTSGLDVASYLREHYPLVPVILLTGAADQTIYEKAFSMGIFDILEKPAPARVLVNRIQNSLLFPQLVQVLWAIMSKELAPPQLEDFMRMPLAEQLRTIHAFSALVKTRSLTKPLKRRDGAA